MNRSSTSDTISIKDGVIGVILARYTPSGVQNQVCYIVEVISDESEKGTPGKR
jgi:hypothetical protein